MRQKEVFKKIGGIIQELSDQYEYLKTVENDLNDLELELFVSNAHFLTDHIEILCKLNLQNKVKRGPLLEKPAKKEIPQEEKYFEPVVQQMKPAASDVEGRSGKPQSKPVEMEVVKPVEEETTSPVQEEPEANFELGDTAAEDSYSFMREEPQTIRHELILDEASTWEEDEYAAAEEGTVKAELEEIIIDDEVTADIAEQEIAGPSIEKADEQPVESPATVLPNDENDEVLTINQKISSQLGDKATKTEQLSIRPISDIKLAITLNDKLLYVKDLFNGYNLAYSEAIEILNRFNTFEEAMRFLKTNYVTKNNWESKPGTTEKFYALLKRRYAD